MAAKDNTKPEATAPKAENTKPEEKGTETNAGTPSSEAYQSADLAVAEAAGISEGDVKALRDDAGLNQSAGHESDIHAWAITEAGKEFAKGEKDRVKEAEAEAKSYSDYLNKDGLNKAEAAYAEAVSKA